MYSTLRGEVVAAVRTKFRFFVQFAFFLSSIYGGTTMGNGRGLGE